MHGDGKGGFWQLKERHPTLPTQRVAPFLGGKVLAHLGVAFCLLFSLAWRSTLLYLVFWRVVSSLTADE